jgi:hypothetical protein
MFVCWMVIVSDDAAKTGSMRCIYLSALFKFTGTKGVF